MEKETYYCVYRIYRGVRELVGSYQDATDAHDAAKRYDAPYAIIQIEKSSKPKIVEDFSYLTT